MDVLQTGRDCTPRGIVERGDIGALECDTASVGRVDAGQKFAERGLAAARFPDDAERLSGAQIEADVVQRLDRACLDAERVTDGKVAAQTFDAQKGLSIRVHEDTCVATVNG